MTITPLVPQSVKAAIAHKRSRKAHQNSPAGAQIEAAYKRMPEERGRGRARDSKQVR